MRFSISALILLFSVQIEAATWYVDFSAGNDANVGSVGSPLKRSPGMTGFTGSATLAAGDVVMFNGGVVWPSNCFPLAPTSGTVGSAQLPTPVMELAGRVSTAGRIGPVGQFT